MDTEHLVGQQIDGYRIIKHIDRGGMADVYLAEDVDLKRKVALKIMLDTLAMDPQFVQRFRREAQTAAQLNHPNIVQVYAVGMSPTQSTTTQRPYIAMRFIEGGSLRDKLRQLAQRGKLLTTEQALNIVRQVALALSVAHDAGVVHRDLKPGNVLIRPDGTPVLVDLGIASVSSGPKLTQTGSLIGTPNYMSPEQVRGKKLDGRSDLYSLGIILYEMLAGIRPFEADESIAVLHKQVYEEPIPLHNYRSELSPETLAIVETCLQKIAAGRFQDAAEMVAAIDHALRLEGTEGPNPEATQVLTNLHDSALISRPQIAQPSPTAKPAIIELSAAEPPRRTVPVWAIVSLVLLAALVIFMIVVRPFTPTSPTTTIAAVSSTAIPTESIAEAEIEAIENDAQTLPTNTPTEPPPTSTATPSPTASPTATQTPVPLPESVTWDMGRSSKGETLLLTQIGSGRRRLVFIGGVHGNEPLTRELVAQMMQHFQANLELVSPEVSLYFLPTLNPDGMAADSRYTPGGVDLNRNWETPTWISDSPEPGGIKQNSGGAVPFSEPETAALRDFLLGLLNDPQTESVSVMLYHHHSGVPNWGNVQPGYIQYGSPVSPSIDLALRLLELGGYNYLPYWDGAYTPTGEIIQWCATQEIAAVDIEISHEESLHTVPAGRSQTVLETAVESVIGLME